MFLFCFSMLIAQYPAFEVLMDLDYGCQLNLSQQYVLNVTYTSVSELSNNYWSY